MVGKVGACQLKSAFEIFNPVCSCDGITFFNICDAMNRFGVYEFKKPESCTCIDSTFIKPAIVCSGIFNPVCGCDGHAYKNLCEAVFKNGVLRLKNCNCIEPDLINDKIDCNTAFDQELVCGCDGRTYPNICYAQYKAGIVMLSNIKSGPCTHSCKDSILAIVDIPCSDSIDPVCGCDQVTYANECIARYKHGVLKWNKGACKPSNIKDTYSTVKLDIYPNPASEFITLFSPEGKNFNLIEIFNSNGSLIFKKNINFIDSTTISLDSLTYSGFYFLHLTSSSEKVIKRLIVIK
ncbi:MAG: T9SS type A sorting domain-containing protein [Saprospiraceae bacterium]|nr:T9SS type A sorting domain-containing protein [Saprospiraceae bacterium]